MRGCFGVGRALERALARLAPVLDSRLAYSSLGKVTRQNLRLIFRDFSELAFEGLCDASVKSTPGLAQQCAVSRVPHKGVLKQISHVRHQTLAEQKTCLDETIKRRLKFNFRLAR